VRKRRPELAKKSDEELAKLIGEEMTPVGRFGRTAAIAASAAFLASERNGLVTGDTIEASAGVDRFMSADEACFS